MQNNLLEKIRFIYNNIPIFIRWIISVCIISPIIGYIIIRFIKNKPTEFSVKNLQYLIILILLLIIIGLFIGSSQIIDKLQKYKSNEAKKSSYEKIKIGEYSLDEFSVAIFAKVQSLKNFQPSIDIFLDRVDIGDPYCKKCKNPLNLLRSEWMADGAPVGYKCKFCKIKIDKSYNDIKKEVKGEIRKNYDNYWNTYSKKIDEIKNK